MKAAFISVVCVMIAGCAARLDRIASDYLREGSRLYKRYLAGNASEAKLAVDQMIALTERTRKRAPRDMGFEWSLALDHLRLHYIARYAGRAEEAHEEWNLAVAHWRLTHGSSTATPEAMKEFLEQLEREYQLPWLIEEKPNQAPEPTTMLVTPRASARVAPSMVVAHL